MGMHMVRMWVTERCNALCPHCMNVSSRGNAQMPFEKFELLCDYFVSNHFDKIGIMGGEPTIHPDFLQIMSKAQESFGIVYLFTNALYADNLILYKPRKRDAIIYNFSFSKSITKEKLMLDKDGERILDVVVNSNTDIVELEKEIRRVASYDSQRIQVQLVLNNSCNIFAEKKEIIKKINAIYNSIASNTNIRVVFQCGAPLCFTYGESLPPFSYNTMCPDEAVLIDGSCNVCFCNIHTDRLINIFQGMDLIPYKILNNYIRKESLRIKQICLDKICKDCFFYASECNGKCHISQDCIAREDIIANTKLPWLK